MSLLPMIIGASAGASAGASGEVVEPKGVDFDGTNDYLSRSSDLVGNTDSKTFTFSCWVYRTNNGVNQYIYSTDTGSAVQLGIYFNTSNYLVVVGRNGSTVILSPTVTSPIVPTNTYTHILISIDMNNTANRSIYINDTKATVTWGTYTNSVLYFTNASHLISKPFSGVFFKGRLSHLFLAYEYVDLYIESNRRMFITADGKPA